MNERLSAVRRADDGGFTLIEVVVALLVFAILSTGIVAGSTTIIRMTTDNRARVTAANLASQDLDVVRAIANPFDVTDTDGYTSIDGRTYHVVRSVSWINSIGDDVTCNSGANLFFLRVNTRVTWAGMLGSTSAVQDDTILAPSAGTTDSESGAIGIYVQGLSAQPIGGVTVTVSLAPSSTGVLPATQPKPTTSEGCTYVNDLKPGAYVISVTKAGYRGDNGSQPQQGSTINHTLTVSAGTTNSYTFTYDQAATYNMAYSAGPAPYSGPVRLPSNLPVNLISGGTPFVTTASPGPIGLFPYTSGYSVVAGPFNSGTSNCSSVDPAAWNAGIVNGVALKAGVRAFDAKSSGQIGTLTVPLGVVLVKAPAGATLTATQAPVPEGIGNPGCSITGTTLNWSAKASGGWDALQLPYGSWTVRADGSALAALDLQVVTNVAQPGVGVDGTVTLDPRNK